MKAELILRQKEILDNGLVISMTVWKLPESNAERPHGIKYSFHCGTLDGKTIVRYDNEHGKGDHRHYDAEKGTRVKRGHIHFFPLTERK